MSSKGADGTVRPTSRAATQAQIVSYGTEVSQVVCDQTPVSQAQTVNP